MMGTLLEVTADSGADAAFAEVERLDALLSTFKEDSEVSRLNARAGAAPSPVSADLWAVLEVSSRVWAASGGAFDPTFESSPSARGFWRLTLHAGPRAAALPAGGRLNFGAVGKGYALDAAARALRARGVRRALLNFGGQVYALGAWTVETAAGPVALTDASASSSGESEQPGHIVDPFTGRPLHRPAVTVAAPSAAEADAWSTALYVGGPRILPPDFSGCALVIPLRGARPERYGRCKERMK
ncbi:MAG: FAD:protein FMN transferase [Elusimicrobia bacterium]|nr:FAD:protein FMN transferase [Elusimicrobiota bacterium]